MSKAWPGSKRGSMNLCSALDAYETGSGQGWYRDTSNGGHGAGCAVGGGGGHAIKP